MGKISKRGATVPKPGTGDTAFESRIGNALFGGTQQRVLGVLFGNPGRSYYMAELFAATQSGRGAVQRELSRLVDADLISVRQQGKQKHYQANPKSPVFHELHGLILKTAGLADVLRSALSGLASRIKIAFIYGSLAKGGERSGSDVDLLVVSDDLHYADLYEAISSAELHLGRPINPQIYSTEQFESRRNSEKAFVARVLAQPKVWLIGTEDDIAS